MSGISKVKVPEVVFPRVFSASEEMGYVRGCPHSWTLMPVFSQDTRQERTVLIQKVHTRGLIKGMRF